MLNVNEKVMVKINGNFTPAEITKLYKSGSVQVKIIDTGKLRNIKPDDVRAKAPSPSSESPSRTSRGETLTVAELIEQLKATDNRSEKKRIRAALRRQGHTGGLRSVGN